jgi:hypothetical protein
MLRRWTVLLVCTVTALVVTVGGVGAVLTARRGTSGYLPRVEPGDFTARIDNPFLPLLPGMRWVYAVVDPDGRATRAVTEVTGDTRMILGVVCVVVRDTATVGEQVVKDSIDWYAQDLDGNVWYFGAEAREFRDGRVVSTAGSWEAGARDAQPGMVMKAAPKVGDSYQLVYDQGRAEDKAQVLSLDQRVSVPYGFFDQVRVIKRYTPLAPGTVVHEFYAPGVGMVLAVTVEGGAGHTELVEMTRR